MATKSLGELLRDADILQQAAKLTGNFGVLNDTILQILREHLDKVKVRFAPKRPHVWGNRLAVLEVVCGRYNLKIPVPELKALDGELARRIEELIMAMDTTFVQNLNRIIGAIWTPRDLAYSVLDWENGTFKSVYVDCKSYGSLSAWALKYTHGIDFEDWTVKGPLEKALIEAIGVWRSEVGGSFYETREGLSVERRSVQGLHDPISYPVFVVRLDKERVVKAAQACWLPDGALTPEFEKELLETRSKVQAQKVLLAQKKATTLRLNEEIALLKTKIGREIGSTIAQLFQVCHENFGFDRCDYCLHFGVSNPEWRNKVNLEIVMTAGLWGKKHTLTVYGIPTSQINFVVGKLREMFESPSFEWKGFSFKSFCFEEGQLV